MLIAKIAVPLHPWTLDCPRNLNFQPEPCFRSRVSRAEDLRGKAWHKDYVGIPAGVLVMTLRSAVLPAVTGFVRAARPKL